jgi:hypothetical protein
MIIKFDSNGKRIWGTYYGGDGSDEVFEAKLINNSIYLAGRTSSTNLGLNGIDDTKGGGFYDGYIARIDSSGIPIWATYIGGNDEDFVAGISVDSSLNVYYIGSTASISDLPIKNAYLNSFQGNTRTTTVPYEGDAFFGKINSSGNNEFMSYYGGENNEQCIESQMIGVNDDGFLYFSGLTVSENGIAENGFDEVLNTSGGTPLTGRFGSFLAKMKLEYQITLSESTGGKVIADKSGYIQHGQPLEISFEPDEGYLLSEYVYNSNTYTAVDEFTIDAVRNPVDITPIWEIDPVGDIDGDGIPNQVELDAPNGGDANGDGTSDIFQLNVASILDSNSNRYLTVESTSDLVQDLNVFTETDDNYIYPYGLNEFKLNASFDSVKIIYHDITNLDGLVYRKQKADNEYVTYDAEFSQIEIDGKTVAQVTLFLIDGGLGDFDGEVNGVIFDPGGPAFLNPDSSVPFWDWWHLALLGVIISIHLYRKSA